MGATRAQKKIDLHVLSETLTFALGGIRLLDYFRAALSVRRRPLVQRTEHFELRVSQEPILPIYVQGLVGHRAPDPRLAGDP